MPTDKRLETKGRCEPRRGLMQQAKVSIGLAHKHAAPLAKAGWPKEKTAALEEGLTLLEAKVSTQHEVRGEARGATRSEHQAITAAKAFLRRLRHALVMVLRESPLPGVSAESFEVRGTLARSTPKISGYLAKIRSSVALLDPALQPYFEGENASLLLDKAKGELDGADTRQEVAATGLPVETGKIYEAKGKVLELVEDLNRVAKIAFDGQATMIAQFNKDVLLRARRSRKKDKSEDKSEGAPAPEPAEARRVLPIPAQETPQVDPGDGASQPGRSAVPIACSLARGPLTLDMASCNLSRMVAIAPHSLAADHTDPVLAAAQRAPLVELTKEEQALLAEVESRPHRWISHEHFASKLRPGDEQR